MQKTLMVLIITGLLLAGCAAAPAQSTPKTLPTATTTPNANPWTVIEYTRSGGIAGRTETWTLYPDGRLTNGTKEFKLSPKTANELADLLIKGGIKELGQQPTKAPVCADCIVGTITMKNGEQEYALSAVLEDPSTAEKVRTLFNQIDQFIQKAVQP